MSSLSNKRFNSNISESIRLFSIHGVAVLDNACRRKECKIDDFDRSSFLVKNANNQEKSFFPQDALCCCDKNRSRHVSETSKSSICISCQGYVYTSDSVYEITLTHGKFARISWKLQPLECYKQSSKSLSTKTTFPIFLPHCSP